MNLDDLDIKAEYEEYEEGNDISLWEKPYPCWVKYNKDTKELSVKLEVWEDDESSTYVWYRGYQSNSDISNRFTLFSNKPDVTNETMFLEIFYEDGFWYLEGKTKIKYQGKVENHDIDIREIKN